MWSASNNQKSCATCANWAGPRRVRGLGVVETSSPSVRGKCYAGVPCSASEGEVACGGISCRRYELWPALKR